MVPLPNSLWLRSTKQPEWATCLDPEDAVNYGRKCRERESLQCWEPRGLLRLDEVELALSYNDCSSHWPQLTALKSRLEA